MIDRAASPSAVAPGAKIVGPSGALIVVDVCRREHSAGYGPVDLLVTHAHDEVSPGSMVSTPWGMAEVVAAAVSVGGDGDFGHSFPSWEQQISAPQVAPPVGAADICARLVEIERHLTDATPGTHQRDCAGRIFAIINGEEMQIGEAYAQGDARLWRHAATDIRWLVDELKRRMASV